MMQKNNPFGTDWSDFYKAVEGRPPRLTLTEALERFGETTGTAVDLGCGNGNDTFELLRHGWHVLAIDAHQEAMARVGAGTPPELRNNLVTRQSTFEELTELPPSDLVYAGFALPFCKPGHFDQLWNIVTQSVNVGGRFAGQFFGTRDEWAGNPEMTFHTGEQVRGLFDGFHIEWILEVDEDGKSATGNLKHWHVFSVIACRLTHA